MQPFTDMPNLKNFYLAWGGIGRTITGQITEFTGCPALEVVELGNPFGGTLPSFATNLNLKSLNAPGCLFTGTLPSFLNNTLLTTLNIYTNGFTGAFPSFAGLTNLSILQAYSNQFSGTLPEFTGCTALSTIFLWQNQFSGTLPSFLSCTNLSDARFWSNQFSGTLPSFAGLLKLTRLDISGNYFSGALPSFNGCNLLNYLSLTDNSFSGTIPDFLGCAALQNFYAGGVSNAWSGVVPYFPPSLKVLDFSIYTTRVAGSNLTFPIDLLDNLTELIQFTTTGVFVNAPKTIPNISNNTKLSQVQFNYTPNLSQGDSYTNGTINFSNFAITEFRIYRNVGVSFNFTNLITRSIPTSYWAMTDSGLNITFPFGEKIRTSTIHWGSNGTSQANQDASFASMFTYRNNFNNTVTKNMTAVQTVAPSGIYQMPAGFTHDLNEAQIDALTLTTKEKIWILVNCQVSVANTTKRYKWNITTA